MGLPYQTEDYDEVGGGSGSASTVNDLGGMNFSTLDNNELMKRVDANNVGGSGITSVETTVVGSNYTNQIKTFVGSNELASISTTHNIIANYKNMQLKPDGSNSVANGVNIQSVPASTDTRVGINVQDPEEALDIEGNIELRGASGKIFFKHPSGLQKVELDADQDGTNGGKFIVKTKEDNGNMTQKFEINNLGNALLNGNHFAQAYYFAKYGTPRSAERLKVTKEEILSLDSVSQSLPDPNKSEPISCQGLLDCASNAVIASTNATGLHTLPPSGSVIKSYLDNFSGFNQVNILSVKKTSTQVIASGGTSKIVSWATPHVDINTGTSGWDNANSRYIIQNSATYKISFSAIINNSGNDTSSLRFLNGAAKIYNTGATLLHTESDTTILYNVDNTAGRTERGSVHIEIIRTLNATDYIETEISSLESTGNYNIEGATLNVEQVSYGNVNNLNNYAQHISQWGDIKVGNSSTPYWNNNTLDQWLPLYNQNNQQQLFQSITLNNPTRPVKIEACVNMLYNETTIGMRVVCNNGITTSVVYGTTTWRQSNGPADNDTAPYVTSIVHVPNGNANVTYTIEGYVRSNFPGSNPFFFINTIIMPPGNVTHSSLLLTEL